MTTTVSTTTLPNDDVNENDADKNILTLTHEESSCRIHLFGATVLSFNDHLFCSKHAHFDGSKPIRGGIPIVFPIFGPPSQKSTMPQHGFARCNYWTLTDVIQEEHACVARLCLALTDVVHGRGANNPWSIEQAALDQTDCRLEYKVRLEKQRLTCALTVLNTGASSFAFNSLLHTYLHVPARNTTVRGLGGYSKLNQLCREADAVTQPYDEPIAVLPEMDAVYTHPDHHPTAHIYVGEHLELKQLVK
jgi:glucose-6-phosphate 1-epimerase